MIFSDAILMDEKPKQLQHTFVTYFRKAKYVAVVVLSLVGIFFNI